MVVKGKKVVGSAQVRHGSAFLQHGSILLDGYQDVVNAVSRQPSAVSAATTLSSVLGRPVTFDEVTAAIVGAWDPKPAPSSPALSRPFPSSFADPSWTWRR